MKTIIRLKNDDTQHNAYKKGEEGYIDGYCRGGQGIPYCMVVIGDRIIMCTCVELEVV